MDATQDIDARLGALLDEYQRRKSADPGTLPEAMKDAAGELYAEFADLAGCLDLVQGGSPGQPLVASPEAGPAPSARAGRGWRRAPVIGIGLLAVATIAWVSARSGSSRLSVRVHPAAPVLVDGRAFTDGTLDAGVHRIEVELAGYRRHEGTVELRGHDVVATVHLVPRDPFDERVALPLAKSYGVQEEAAAADVPRPVGASSDVDAEAALRIRHPDAFALELTRFPKAVRDRDDIRIIAARCLFRAGLHAESYAAARAVAERHPDRPEPWLHCARALWGLGLVETPLYQEVLDRLDAASASKD